MVSDCDPEGRIFLSVPHTHDGLFFFCISFICIKWVFDNSVTTTADVRHNCDDNTVTFSYVITFSDVNIYMAYRDVL